MLGRSRFPLMLSQWPPAHMTRGDGGLDESHCFDHAPSLNSGRPADPTIDPTIDSTLSEQNTSGDQYGSGNIRYLEESISPISDDSVQPCEDKQIKVWDTKGRCLSTLSGPQPWSSNREHDEENEECVKI